MNANLEDGTSRSIHSTRATSRTKKEKKRKEKGNQEGHGHMYQVYHVVCSHMLVLKTASSPCLRVQLTVEIEIETNS